MVMAMSSTVLLLAHGKLATPRGLADVYHFLRSRGVSVEFRHLYDQPKDIMQLRGQPDIVGISSYTQVSHELPTVIMYARQRWPRARIVLGGRHFCDDVMEIEGTKWKALANHIVIGEGEHAMMDIIGGEQAQVIRGKELSAQDYESLALPSKAFHLANFQSERDRDSALFARGCPFSCVFCNAHRSKLLRHSPDTAVSYLNEMVDWGIGPHIFIHDDVFSASKPWLREFGEECKWRKPRFTLRCFIHGRCFDAETLELLHAARVTSVSLGTESGDDHILGLIGKHTTVAKYREIHRLIEEDGRPMTLHCLWMMGNIGETEETLRATVQLSQEIGNDKPWFSYAIPFPGTQFWKVAEDYGTIIERAFFKWSNRNPVFVPFGLTVNKLRSWREKARRWKPN